ncbi:hypothetical protein DNTS_004529 [Danionella cerebrum]|uniref:N-acetyltaurine hydrolase n=1 Tax=Danionella cerebrum TaxID=2873325 RepID=A0A553QEF4_9TELE|nr:hypothetical protein DNTS_004529 [Danionella translucida]
MAQSLRSMSDLRGKVQTVMGLIEPSQLGRTLTHEHLSLSFESCYVSPSPEDKALSKASIELKNLHWLQQHPYSHRENLLMGQEYEAVREELLSFRKNGGGTIMAKETGVNVIAGAGFYVDATHSEETRKMTVEKLTDIIVSEVRYGADGTEIRCGVIGEIGTTWPITESEKRVLRATAHAQTELGTIIDHGELLEFARMGSFLEYDLFGTEVLNYHLAFLIGEGYEDRLLIAHDIHTKHRLSKYGGHGYSHILKNIVPKMLSRGITQNQVDKILIENPKQWLTFK